MPKLIISYRRSDSDGIAGRLRDNLAAYYGNDSIFIDVDNIPIGTDFREHIRKAFGDHDLMLAVVGQKWLGSRRGGRARIHEETDPVRVEIEMALQREMPIVPVLVDGARMPKAEELPDSLKPFSFRNAAEVESGRDFRQHMDRLIRSIDQILKLKPRVPGKKAAPTVLMFSVVAVLLVLGVAGIVAFNAMRTNGVVATSNPLLVNPQRPNPQDDGLVEFASLPVGKEPVAARPYLAKYGISVTNVLPEGSEVVFANNRGMYEGGAFMPNTSQIVLTQINTNNLPTASFTLTFARPVERVSFTRPELYAATPSGVTHPKWRATALGVSGQELASQSEALLRQMKNPPERGGDRVKTQTYELVSVTFEGIAAVRFDSDPTLNGRPFAGFSALLIERLVLGASK